MATSCRHVPNIDPSLEADDSAPEQTSMSIASPSRFILKTGEASNCPKPRSYIPPIGKHFHRKCLKSALPFDDTAAQRMSFSGFRFEVIGKARKALVSNA